MLQQAGADGGTSFVRSLLGEAPVEDGGEALRECIAAFQAAGFGQFEIERLDWPIGRVVVRVRNGFEAWAGERHGQKADAPVCAYTAGVLVGFVNALAERRDVVCVEKECQATGAESCLFESLPSSLANGHTVVTFDPDPFLTQHLNLLEIIFNRMPMGIAVFDRDLRLRRFNPTWAEYVQQYTRNPASRVVVGAYFYDLIPGTENTSGARYRRALAGETVREEAVEMNSEGIISFWDTVIAPLVQDDEVIGLVDVTTDATKRKRVEAELRASEEELREHHDQLEGTVAERTAALTNANERLQEEIGERARAEDELRVERNFIDAVLETAGALVIVLDRQGRIVRFNRACEEVSGYQWEELQGQPFWQTLIPQEEVEQVKVLFAKLVGGQFPGRGENRWRTRAGGIRLISWSNTALTDAEGLVQYVVATGIDITAQRRTETALRESEEQYRELVENANSIILRMNSRGEITFINDYAQRFFGFAEEEVLGRNVVGTIVPVADSEGHGLAQMIDDIGRHPERYASNENENVRRDGGRVWVAWTNKAVLDDRGQVEEILCIGNDVTDRKRAEAELQRAHDELEQRVEERTVELTQANASLQEQVAERRRAEEALQHRLAFEDLVTTLSTNFINLAPDEVDRGINQALCAVGEFAGVDRSPRLRLPRRRHDDGQHPRVVRARR